MFNSLSVNVANVFLLLGGLLVELTVFSYFWRRRLGGFLWGSLNLLFLTGSLVVLQLVRLTFYPVFTGTVAAPFLLLSLLSSLFWFISLDAELVKLPRQAFDSVKQVLASVKHSRRWQYVIVSPILAYFAVLLPIGALRVALGGIILFSMLAVTVWKLESKKEVPQE